MSKITIYNSLDYLDNPDDGCEVWNTERRLLLDFFRKLPCEGQVIMQGTVGRWNGTFPAGKTGILELLLSELMECADDVEIYDENGHLFIRTTHHDGSNLFEIKALTDAGLNAVEAFTEGRGRWYGLSEKDFHDKLMNSSRYTHLPKYAKYLGIMPIKAA